MRRTNILSVVLGVVSLSFGILKFVNPFKYWYLTQIKTSGLPHFAYALGIAAEITIGMAFLSPFLISNISVRQKKRLLLFANFFLIVMMLVASVVHLIPAVPADVLPLKLKPPIIPLTFAVVAFFNLNSAKKEIKI
jgi:hypothetical protein